MASRERASDRAAEGAEGAEAAESTGAAGGGDSAGGAEAAGGADVRAVRDTRARLLDAAENLFARGGIAATSLRAVTGAAGANVAAVNYHFGSKQELIREVFARRLGPLNAERLAALDEVLARAGADAPPLEDVLNAFLLPALRLRGESASLVRLIGRAFSEPSAELRALIFSQFDTVFDRFQAALVRALPELPPDQVATRFRYAIGAMAFTMAHLRPGDAAREKQDGVQLVAFLAAGLRAPATREAGS